MSRDLAQLQAALAAVLPGGETITGIRAFSTGHSNETYLIEGLNQILRLPPSSDPLMPDSHGVAAQARIYRALAQTPGAPPVPEVLFNCDDASVLGDPFFVMARVKGEEINDYLPQPWFVDATPVGRDGYCEKWMAAFSDLANLAPLDMLGPVVTPEDEVRRWQNLAREADCAPLVSRFDRLLTVPASRSGAPAPAHGDPKLANLMWADRELTAVLDWELAYNGDPLADLGYMLAFFESDARSANKACGYDGMWKRDRILAHWAAVTGRSPAGIRWHEAAAIGKMAAIVAYGYNLYLSGKSDDARFLKWKEPIAANLGIMDFMLRSIDA